MIQGLAENSWATPVRCVLINRADCTLAYAQSQATRWSLIYNMFGQRGHQPKMKTHGRDTMFLQEMYTWNYNRLPLWSMAEIPDGHWELPLGITAGHCSLNICTDGKTQAKVFSLSRGLHRQSCWSREFTVKQTLSSAVSPPPPELMLQSILIQQSL